MEPMNCTVDYDGSKAHLYVGTHMQTVDHFRAAEILGLAPDKVELTTTFLGGSFGRRANPSSDFVTEAAHVAKAVKKPVQVLWTREDDMRGGQYRPLVHHAVKVGVDKAGKIVAWRHTIVATSIIAGTQFEPMMMKDGIDPTSVEGVADSPYAIPNLHVELHSPKLPVPVQWWRSVGHSHSAYVMETMIDEVAAATKQDPLALRLELLKKHPRQVAVLKTLKDKAGWTKPLAEGMARGISIHESFGSVVGHVAEVSVDNGQPRIHRIVSAVHCGRVVNPGGATAQVESGIVYGLSAALYGAITLKDGRPEQGNFDTYRVLSAAETPKIEVHFVPSDAPPTGLGEPGLPPTAPAVANALAKLTGKRVRALPLVGRGASA
jgi:isoquinoline 1-oxidoreductase beta subunit